MNGKKQRQYRWNRSKFAENMKAIGYIALALIVPAELWFLLMAAATWMGGAL